MFLDKVLGCLRSGDIQTSIELMRSWHRDSQPGDAQAMFKQCPVEFRAKLSLLMRDILTHYPYTVVGAPVLIYWAPDEPIGSLQLPLPDVQNREPCSDLQFLGWISADTETPIMFPLQAEQQTIAIPSKTIISAVALFKTHPGIFELDDVELPDMWWAHLMRHCSGCVNISSRMLLPYPDSLDAALCLQASVAESGAPETNFLSKAMREFAHDAGQLFLETCRQNHSDPLIG